MQADFRSLISSDLFRYIGRDGVSFTEYPKLFRIYPGFKYTFFLRLYNDTRQKRGIYRLIHYWAGLNHKHLIRTYNTVILPGTSIGPGFRIIHIEAGGIVIHPKAVIGSNCTLFHGVTIGRMFRGPRDGEPQIGDDVFIGPGAKVLGNISVGHRAAIGANAVIIDDVPDDAAVVGVPGRVVSFEGSKGIVFHRYSET
ncbi:MAG: serine acetyltransferase [Anaerolineae bacterium]|nr:serine acetyltransferase [Anaerolineae bacterium]